MTNFLSRSIVTRRVSGAPSFEGFQGYADIGIASYNRIFIGNLTIWDMYWDVLFLYKLSAKNFSRLKIETRDSLKFFLPRDAPLSFRNSKYRSYDDWADSSLYFYDLVLPKRINDTLLRKYAVADLNRHFNLNGRYELRESECYILSPKTDKRNDPIQGSETSKIYYPKSQLEKVNASQLTDLLNSKLNSGIIINESKMSDQKLFNLNAALKTVTINQIASIIEPFGLTIYKGKRKIPIFIISGSGVKFKYEFESIVPVRLISAAGEKRLSKIHVRPLRMTNLTDGKTQHLGYEPEPLEKTLKSVTGRLKITTMLDPMKDVIYKNGENEEALETLLTK